MNKKNKDLRIHVISSNYCNNNCVFCMEDKKTHNNLEISVDNIRTKLIKQYKKGVKGILFTSNEPTLNDNLSEMISLAKKIGFSEICLITNGRRLSYKRYLHKLLYAGLTQISISVHGHNNKIHDAITRSPGSFQEALKAINYLSKIKNNQKIKFYSNTTITNINLPHIEEIVKFLSKFEFDNMILNPVIPRGNAKKYVNSIVPKYSTISIKLNKFLSKNKKILVNGFPLCLLNNNYINYGSKEEIIVVDKEKKSEFLDSEFLKIKTDKCTNCILDNVCEGLWEDYFNIYGDEELKPIK